MVWKLCIPTRAAEDFVAHHQRNSLQLADCQPLCCYNTFFMNVNVF